MNRVEAGAWGAQKSLVHPGRVYIYIYARSTSWKLASVNLVWAGPKRTKPLVNVPRVVLANFAHGKSCFCFASMHESSNNGAALILFPGSHQGVSWSLVCGINLAGGPLRPRTPVARKAPANADEILGERLVCQRASFNACFYFHSYQSSQALHRIVSKWSGFCKMCIFCVKHFCMRCSLHPRFGQVEPPLSKYDKRIRNVK